MEASTTSNTTDDEEEDEFHDAFDQFPFYDCADTFDDADVPPAQSSLLRRLSLSDDTCNSDVSAIPSSSTTFGDHAYLKGTEQNEDDSTLTTQNDLTNADFVENVSTLRGNEHLNSNIVLLLAGLVIKCIGFQINLLKFITFPIRWIYTVYMFVMDPLGIVKRLKKFVIRKLLMKIWGLACERLKDYKWILKLGLKCGWGFLWSAYVCTVLVALLVAAFFIGGLAIRVLVEEPIRLQEPLSFNYAEKSPEAYVPFLVSPALDRGVDYMENVRAGKKFSGGRVIPPNHKLQVTVSLKLPESDYNRNLGIFQVRVDFLAANWSTIASSRRPCMMKFKSDPIRLLRTFLRVAPLVTGYASESQHLHVIFRGFTEGKRPTACLRVVIEQRAEFQQGAGVPEIYAASLALDSELPLLRRIVWYWKKTLLVWISMTIFITELLFTLLCCKPVVIPSGKLWGNFARSNAHPNNHPIQR